MAASLMLPTYTGAALLLLLLTGDGLHVEADLCDSACPGSPPPELPYLQGGRFTYRYSTAVATSLHGAGAGAGAGAGRNGLALDCVVDIEVVSQCHLSMQIRNTQIKRLSPQREHPVLSLKTLRESLERTRLKFSLRGGKVTALCLQEGEQVWALNIKRALLSMLQTSHVVTRVKEERETDVHGTCSSRYERRGAAVLKTRDLKRCQQSRLDRFWPQSVTVTEDTSVHMELQCVQRHGASVMEEVNCTEAVSVESWSGTPGLVRTRTVSTLVLLRAQPGTPSAAESPRADLLADLQFEEEDTWRPGRRGSSTPERAARTARLLCSLTSDPQLVSQEFLQLLFQLRDLTLDQLRALWQEASFKCRSDWQPLLEALTACGSENCTVLLTELMRDKEVEEEEARAFLTAVALTPHPSAQIIGSVTALLDDPDLRFQALLAGSALAYQLCQRTRTSCGELPQVQAFMQTLEKSLTVGCEGDQPARVRELFHVLKSVGNAGLSASVFVPLLKTCILGRATRLELKRAAIQAFRRFPCSADRSVLLQLYSCSQEDPEVRVAAYLQLMRCPGQQVLDLVRATLRRDASSQVGSFVWTHLTSVLRSEDPLKQPLIQLLPDDIISKEFEKDLLRYSSYSEHTLSSAIGLQTVETSLIFSPKSFLPRSATANLTVHFHGRAHNLLEVEVHGENFEPLVKSVFGPLRDKEPRKDQAGTGRRTDDGHGGGKGSCWSSTSAYLEQARVKFAGRILEDLSPRCWIGVKVFGSELGVWTCEDIRHRVQQASLHMAGLTVKLLKGQEVQLSHRAVPLTDRLVLPSLSGLPLTLSINVTSVSSLRLKADVDHTDASHFFLSGFVKPRVYVGLAARMGVHSTLGQAAVEWVAELRSSTSLDGSIQLQEGRDVRITLNTPEDVMDIFSLSSRVFQLSGDYREEMKGPRSRVQKTSCTPKTWSKMVGWQLCSNASHPAAVGSCSLPPPGPVRLSLSLLKLDRSLRYYLLEAAYSLHHQRGTWLPRDASIHLLLATPGSSVPRDTSLDLAFSPHRVLLRILHPLKTVLVQGQLGQEKNVRSGRLELVIGGAHYYITGLIDTHSFLSEGRTRYHLEAKMAADVNPMILSANVTRGLGRKSSFSATVKNVFRETASVSVALERRADASSRQYSLEAELHLPGLVGCRTLGLMEQRRSMWSSMLRLTYGLGGDARHWRQECFTSQRLRSETGSDSASVVRADHEFYCTSTTSTAAINHKLHLRHEESSSHITSVLDFSYGKHWDQVNNKRTLVLSQSFKNQSIHNDTSYILELLLQVPERNLNCRTQLLHSQQTRLGSETSTHLKVNYNHLVPLVAGLHWKSSVQDAPQEKWEGSFSVDTPWLQVHTAHKLSWKRRQTLQLSSELTASRFLTTGGLVLEAVYRDRDRGKEARLALRSPAATFLQVEVWGAVGKGAVEASGQLSSVWTVPLRGNISLETSRISQVLQMNGTYGEKKLRLAAAVSGAAQGLKKSQVFLKTSFTEPKSPATEVQLEGVVEELRRDKRTYQKTATLLLRQPLQTFPQALLLQETFTVDLLRNLYRLETKAGLHDNQEVVHTLTLGYKSPKPFVCSALLHPFRSETVPSDSEICVTLSSNQTHREVAGRVRVESAERLTFFGQLHTSPRHSNVKVVFSHDLQLPLPSSAGLEGDACWSREDGSSFEYQAAGKLRMERQQCRFGVQLRGTSSRVDLHSSLSHPFKSRIPKTLEVAAAAAAGAGRGSSSVHVSADGKDRLTLNAQMFRFFTSADAAVGLDLNLSQSLLPSTTDLRVNVAANVSVDSLLLHGSFTQGKEALLAQIKGSLKQSKGLRLAVSGDLRHSVSSFSALPPVLGLGGTLGQSNHLIKGQLRVSVMETVHSLELRHHRNPARSLDMNDEEGLTGDKVEGARDWLCLWSGAEHLCVNVSRQLANQERGEVSLQVCHSFALLSVTGVPVNTSARVKWASGAGRLSASAELQSGPDRLRAELQGGRTDHGAPRWQYSCRLQQRVRALQERGLTSSVQAEVHQQLDAGGLDAGLGLYVEDVRTADILFHFLSKNKTAVLAVSLWQQGKQLQGLVPSSFQTLLPPQASVNVSVTRSGASTDLSSVLQTDGEPKAALSLSLRGRPHLRLRASGWHSLEPIKALHFPTKAELLLSFSRGPGVALGLEFGLCSFRANLGKSVGPEPDPGLSSYTADVTSNCPYLQGTALPASLALQGLLSVAPCRLNVSSSVRLDTQTLSLDLRQSCRTPHLFGTLTHSFPQLGGQGLPRTISVEAAVPEGPEQAGALFIRVGRCNIRARSVLDARATARQLWLVEATCPFLQVHVNGSLVQNLHGAWTVVVNSDVGGGRALLRLDAQPWPELSVEGQLRHDLPALGALPASSRLRITARSGKLRHRGDLLLQTEECVVRAEGGVMLQPGLQGSLLYHNNCTAVQDWGGPRRMQVSGSLLVSADSVGSQINLEVDDTNLHALLALRETKDESGAPLNVNRSAAPQEKLLLPTTAVPLTSGSSYVFTFNSSVGHQTLSQEVTVAKTSEAVRVTSAFRHTVNHLEKLGVPASSHFQGLCSIQGTSSLLRVETRLSVAGQKLLTSGLNVSVADAHLAALLSYSPAELNQTRRHHKLDAVLTAQFRGPLRGVSLDVCWQDWQVGVTGDVGGWGTPGGTKEAKVTLKHTTRGQKSPVLQVEAWGRLTGSQLRCSMAVNPERSSSLALVVQGHQLPQSKDLMLKVAHNIPDLTVYLPPQLSLRSQLNRSRSGGAGVVEVFSGGRTLWALGELAAIQGGFRQSVEVKHSCPQLKPLPRSIAVRTVYESRKWSRLLQQAAVWGAHQFSLSGFYSDPPALDMENQTLRVQLRTVPRLTSLEVTLERSLYGGLDSVFLGWTRRGHLEQASALRAWTHSEDRNQTTLELQQPFSSTLRTLSLQTESRSSKRDKRVHQQAHLSLEGVVPVNISVSLSRQWQTNSSRGQVCTLWAAPQTPASSVHGCVSVSQEGPLYSQDAEFTWGQQRVNQAVEYQKTVEGLHSLQVHVGLDGVSPSPCPSHTLLAKVGTNLRDRLEHTVLLDTCPPQPAPSWSGSRGGRSAEEVFSGRSRLAGTGRPHECSFTLVLANSSTARGLNVSLSSESRMGNWSLEVGGRALSWPGGWSLQTETTMDHREKILLNGTLEGGCLQTTAGYVNGPGLGEDLTAVVCVGSNHTAVMTVRRGHGGRCDTLGSVSLETANQRLMLRASGCLEGLTAAEKRLQYLSTQIENKLRRRIKTLQHFVADFRKQSRDGRLLQGLSVVPLHISKWAEVLLEQENRGLMEQENLGLMEQENRGLLEQKNRGLMEQENRGLMEQKNRGLLEQKNRGLMEQKNRGLLGQENRGLLGQENRGLMEQKNRGLMEQKNRGLLEQKNRGLMEQKNRGLLEQKNRGLMEQKNRGLLGQEKRGLLALWHRSLLRHMLTNSLPRFLSALQDASLLAQQELRRPLATLAGVYQDVKGQKLGVIWREAVLTRTDQLVDVLAALPENPHLKPLSQAGAAALKAALDMAGRQTFHWTETRLAAALSGLRKQLASLYNFSSRECEVAVAVFLPRLSSSQPAGAGLMEVLLEEWLLGPLRALTAIQPRAEFYRLKRKLMDSPFSHQALLVADQFVVTFDGRLYELPGPCPLLLAREVTPDPAFTLLLSAASESFLLVHMNNRTIDIQRSGDVKMDCSDAVTSTSRSDDGLTVRRGSNTVQVSNQDGGSVSCDLSLELCSFTLDGWSHGASTGLMGTNDNDAFNDFPLPDGSQAEALEDFFHSWLLRPKCSRRPDPEGLTAAVSCRSLFSSADSLLSSCFRVVDPGQFLSVCEAASSRAPCRLASAFVHLCRQNFLALEVPAPCTKA